MAKSFIYYRDMYLNELEKKNYSKDTIESYLVSLNRFYKYLISISKEDLREIDEDDIQNYYIHLREEKTQYKRPLKQGSILCFVKVLYGFFKYLELTEQILSSPVRIRKRLRKTALNPPRDVLNISEIEEIFKMPELSSAKGFRDRVVLETLYCTGIRKSELVNLDTNDIDIASGLLFIRQGKGKKDRIVPLTKSCLAWLQEYIKKVRPVLLCFDTVEQSLFVTRYGKRFSRNTLSRIIREYVKKSGIVKNVTTHTFRHTFASHMIKGGAKVRYVQEILGHERLSTTQIYTRVYVEDLKKAMKMHHPRENQLYEAGDIKLPDRRTGNGNVMLLRVCTSMKIK